MPGTSAPFPDNDTEAWRGKVTCPESHSEWEAGLGCETMKASSASVLSHHVAAPGQPLVTSQSDAFPFLLLFKLQLSPSASHFPLHPLQGGQGGTSFSTLLTLPHSDGVHQPLLCPHLNTGAACLEQRATHDLALSSPGLPGPWCTAPPGMAAWPCPGPGTHWLDR